MVITNVGTKEPVEQWDFNVKYEGGSGTTTDVQELKDTKVQKNGKADIATKCGHKELKVIQNEIRDVLRQICSTVSFLPLLDCLCKHICYCIFQYALLLASLLLNLLLFLWFRCFRHPYLHV